MESIIRSIGDIESDKLKWLESNLGQHLQENQQVIIMVVTTGKEPDAETRRQYSAKLKRVREEAAKNIEARGFSLEEMDTAVDEAMEHLRPDTR